MRSPANSQSRIWAAPIVVATMGAADLHLLQTNPQLSRISTALFDLKPMNRLHLRDVITGPARRLTAGGQRLMVEPALVDRLVNDATGVADQLPLLALTLARLYEDYGSGGVDAGSLCGDGRHGPGRPKRDRRHPGDGTVNLSQPNWPM